VPPVPAVRATPKTVLFGRIDWRRTFSRALGVGGILFYVATWRIDQAVHTAYASSWTGAAVGGCFDCRLPTHTWVGWHVGLGLFAPLLLTAALWIRAAHVLGSNGNKLFAALSVCVAAATVTALVFRILADLGGHRTFITFAFVADVVIFGLLAFTAAAAAAAAAAAMGGTQFSGRLRRFVQRHRINLIALLGLAIVLLVVGQTSGQAVDSVRSWVSGGSGGYARLAFGLSTTVLLALVVYESSVRLVYIHAEGDPLAGGHVASAEEFRAWRWFVAALITIAAGLAVGHFAPAGYPLVIPGILMLVIVLLDLGTLGGPDAAVAQMPAMSPADEPTPECPALEPAAAQMPAVSPADEPTPEYLAIVPLLAVSAVTIAASVDAALSDGRQVHGHSLLPLIPGGILAVVAILFTGAGGNPELPSVPILGRGWLYAALATAGAGGFLYFMHSASVAGGFGMTLFVLLTLYAWCLFHADQRLVPRAGDFFIALPLAACTGAVVAIAIHADPYAVAELFGVFGLINIALAAILTLLHYAVAWSLGHKPPQLLHALGLRQLPIITLLVISWVAAGFMLPHATHDVRVVDVHMDGIPIAKPNRRITVRGAFNEWLAEQKTATGKTETGSAAKPIPLVLVAAHGGGIRAAYWTALALDCITAAADQTTSRSSSYSATCRDDRRGTNVQAVAARHILLASGVSGGAVGLFAYARERLATARLDSGWVDDKLGKDFASPTIGWGLFHDVPNHLIGLAPAQGGVCEWHLNGHCVTEDRTSVLEETFDRPWRSLHGPPAFMRALWYERAAKRATEVRRRARTVPIIVDNSTAAGGQTRAVTAPILLGNWPLPETARPERNTTVNLRPLAATLQTLSALCANGDMRLSTAAMLASRFPYVSAAGRINDKCAPHGGTKKQLCLKSGVNCAMRLVDGGYTENSGLFTIDALLPALQQLVIRHNAKKANKNRQVAIVVVEIDNHYRARPQAAPNPPSGTGESLVPLATAFGGHATLETFARADAYRLTPPSCTLTVSPGLHPGVMAPLGWELSDSAVKDLQDSLVRARSGVDDAEQPLAIIRRLQKWLARSGTADKPLSACIPKPPK
jgi:hypothetical protein